MKKHLHKVRITELPIGTWTEDYKIFVEKEIDAKRIKDISDMSTDKVVDMTITFARVLEKSMPSALPKQSVMVSRAILLPALTQLKSILN